MSELDDKNGLVAWVSSGFMSRRSCSLVITVKNCARNFFVFGLFVKTCIKFVVMTGLYLDNRHGNKYINLCFEMKHFIFYV